MSGANSSAQHDRTGEIVRVVVPLDTRYAATVRLVAASLGADAGFDVDDIDDLRLGVSEVFALLADGVGGGDLDVEFSPGPGTVWVRMSTSTHRGPLELDMISRNILATAVDTFEERDDGAVVMIKRTSAPTA